jgi:hypothetical protein
MAQNNRRSDVLTMARDNRARTNAASRYRKLPVSPRLARRRAIGQRIRPGDSSIRARLAIAVGTPITRCPSRRPQGALIPCASGSSPGSVAAICRVDPRPPLNGSWSVWQIGERNIWCVRATLSKLATTHKPSPHCQADSVFRYRCHLVRTGI